MSGLVVLNVVSGLAWAIPGAYLARHRPRVVFGWLALVAAAGHWIAAILGADDGSTLTGFPASAEVVEQPALMAMYALFPDGRLPRSWLRWPSVASLSLAVVGVPVAAVNADLVPAFFAPSAVLALAVLGLRWWAAVTTDDRRPLLWLLAVGVAVTVITVPAVALLPTTQGAAVGLGLTLLELAVVVAATLRHHVYGIDVVLSRTLLYALLTGLVAAVFVAAAGLASLIGVDSDRVPAFAGAAVSVLVLTPARSFLQRRVDRFVWGSSGDPYAVVAGLTADFSGASTPQAVIASYLASMKASLRVPWVLLSYGSPRRIAFAGEVRGQASSFPVVHRGQTLGDLSIGLRRGEVGLRRAERRLMTDLAAHAALVVESVNLAGDLQASRERVVAAREEERRRLRMDLHDGLGPQLTGIALGLDVASEKVDHPDVASALESLRVEVIDALGNLRRLVTGLRPPRLDEVGLVGAVGEAVDRLRRGGLQVTFTSPPGQVVLPAAVEVAVLRIAEEAITNVAKHAAAIRCDVVLSLDEEIRIEVHDDGVGGTGSSGGTGLESMRHRAEELGGTLVTGTGPDITSKLNNGFHAHDDALRGWLVAAAIPLAHQDQSSPR